MWRPGADPDPVPTEAVEPEGGIAAFEVFRARAHGV
jgi:hypothetical protein